MSIKDMAAIIGKAGVWYPDIRVDAPFGVAVRVVDVRRAYGRTDYQITPLQGSGVSWVTAHTVELERDK